MKLSVLIVNRRPPDGTLTGAAEQARTEDVVAVAQETGIPLRMLNDMVASWENADSHPIVAIERGLRWDPNLVYRVEVIPTREPDHEPYDVPVTMRHDCVSCDQLPAAAHYGSQYRCPRSKRECGHHCNHSWSHDRCDWCGEEFGEIDAPPS